MRVKVKNYIGKEMEVPLADALRPSYSSDHGTLEGLVGLVGLLSAAVGSICAHLVETGSMSLGDAARITKTDNIISAVEGK